MLVSSSFESAEKTSGPPVDESLRRIARSKVRAEGSAPPTLHNQRLLSASAFRSESEEREAEDVGHAPSENDSRDLVEGDKRRLLRDEQQLFLEEVQLALVRLEIALDRRLPVVPVAFNSSSA